MKKIKWNISKQEVKQELVSRDNRWHISKQQSGEDEIDFLLTNYDLLISPIGKGTNYKTCFESFIENCEKHIEKIKKMQQEARDYIAAGEAETEAEK